MGIQGCPNDWREDMLKNLIIRTSYSHVTITKVKWLSARDMHVCSLCAARDGRIYTIQQAKKELEGEFCKPGDPDDRCRCTFLPVIDD